MKRLDLAKTKAELDKKAKLEQETRHKRLLDSQHKLVEAVDGLCETIEGKNWQIDVSAVVAKIESLNFLKDDLKNLQKAIDKLPTNYPETKEVKISNLERLIKAIPDNKIDLSPVVRELEAIKKKASERIVSREPSDYIPVRRVVNLGNRLMFDDSSWSSGGSGGASVQDSLIDNGRVKVTGTITIDTITGAVEITNDAGNPIPISASSLPLPSGAATAANQQTDALTDTQLRATPVVVDLGSNNDVSLNAGSNAIGKLAANSGVDIGDVDVTSQVSGSLDHGSNLDIDTTAEQITATSFSAKFGVTVKSDPTNTDTVWIGNSDVTAGTTAATDGIPLEPGESITLPVNNPNLLYAIGSSANNKVYWTAV